MPASSELKTRINDALKTAMRAKDKPRVAVLRLVTAAFKRVEVDERVELDDARVLAILDKMVKQRRDSAQQYRDADRQELAEQEEFEIDTIQAFMPQPLSDAELEQLVTEALEQTGAETMKDMGKVMGILKPQVQGRADMADVSKQLKAKLG